jgi:hypothetical protein
MRRNIGVHKASLLILALGLAGTAGASTVYFENKVDFLRATGPLVMESFEGLPATNSPTTASFVLADFTVTGTYAPPCLGIWNTPYNGSFATDGVKYLRYQCDANESLIFDFAIPVNAFGLYVTDWGDMGEGVLTFTNDAGDVVQVDIGPHPDGHLLFFGAWNDQFLFTRAILTQTIAGEAYGCDEVYCGVASPVMTAASSWGAVKALFD